MKWRKSLSDLVLFLPFDTKLTKNEIAISIERTKLTVKIRDFELEGKLFQMIDPDESTWTISPGGVEVMLQKVCTGGWL